MHTRYMNNPWENPTGRGFVQRAPLIVGPETPGSISSRSGGAYTLDATHRRAVLRRVESAHHSADGLGKGNRGRGGAHRRAGVRDGGANSTAETVRRRRAPPSAGGLAAAWRRRVQPAGVVDREDRWTVMWRLAEGRMGARGRLWGSGIGPASNARPPASETAVQV